MVLNVADSTVITLKERYPIKTSKTKIFVDHHKRLENYVMKNWWNNNKLSYKSN